MGVSPPGRALLLLLHLLLLDPPSWADLPTVGRCKKAVRTDGRHRLIDNEGTWFLQYRSWLGNTSCHTAYESVYLDEDKTLWLQHTLYTDQYTDKSTTDPIPILMDITEDKGIYRFLNGPYGEESYSFLLALTPEYRVRYICTMDGESVSDPHRPLVLLETRSLFPKKDVIEAAVADIEKAGIGTFLWKVRQRGCKRPLKENH